MTQNAWDTPSLTADGQLLIAQASGRPAAATLTAGSANVTITNGSGTITVNTVSSATNWVKITATDASASSEIDFTGLSATYGVYRIVITNLKPANDGSIFYMRTSTDNGVSFDNGASDYQWSQITSSTSSNSANESTADTQIELTESNLGNGTNETADIDITLYNPSATKYTKATWTASYANSSSATRYAINGGGYRQDTVAVDAIRFLMDTGNITTGEFVLYGLTA